VVVVVSSNMCVSGVDSTGAVVPKDVASIFERDLPRGWLSTWVPSYDDESMKLRMLVGESRRSEFVKVLGASTDEERTGPFGNHRAD
jgi:hypothetical protein